MNKSTLSRFANAMYSEAMAKKEETLEELRKEKSVTLAKLDTELRQEFADVCSKFAAESKSRVQAAVSKRETELLNELRSYRHREAEMIFKEAEKRLREFVTTDGYEKYLRACFEKLSGEFNRGKTICIVRKCDAGLISGLCGNMEIQATDRDIIGGFVLENAERRICADCTLITALEEQKRLFPETCGAVIG